MTQACMATIDEYVFLEDIFHVYQYIYIIISSILHRSVNTRFDISWGPSSKGLAIRVGLLCPGLPGLPALR